MIRCMMLALTMTLITLSAAYLGRDRQLQQVLHQTKIPMELSSSASIAPPPSEVTSLSSEPSDAPRFIPDKPISSMPENYTEPSASEMPIDPSAEAQLFPIESSSEQYVPTPPTEKQKLAAAEPFVKELFELTEQSAVELRALIDKAIGEFLSATPSERNGIIPALIEKYTPLVTELESRSDTQAEAILLRMKAALVAIGADDGLVNDARAAYDRSKQEQISHYTEIFSAFVPPSALGIQ